MTGPPGGGEPAVELLRQQIQRLSTELVGPLRRVRMHCGDAVVEVEWQPARTSEYEGRPIAPNGGAGSAPVGPGSAGQVDVGPSAVGTPAAASAGAVGTAVRQTVVSPIVGTFFRAPEPGAPPFVDVGDVVEPGQVVGIVEAMKLMNRITADQAGTVVEVLVGDGEPVEFAQPLIALVTT